MMRSELVKRGNKKASISRREAEEGKVRLGSGPVAEPHQEGAVGPPRPVLPSAPARVTVRVPAFSGVAFVLDQGSKQHWPSLPTRSRSLWAAVLPYLGNSGSHGSWSPPPDGIVLCALVFFLGSGSHTWTFLSKVVTVKDLRLRKCHCKTF